MRKHIILAITILLAIPAVASTKRIDPITQAVLNAYEDILKEEPGDYHTLYQRAVQYYQLEMFDNAMDDIDRALRLTPDSDKELKAKEFELEASIYAMQEKYSDAITAIRHALDLQPANNELQYRLGEFALLAGDTETAKGAFSSIQRRVPRSPEAMLGLARVDIAQGKLDEAMSKMKLAEEFNSSLWTTHQSIGDLLTLLGQPQQAALSYIKAMAMADGQSMPLESLFKLANSNYPAVKLAIEDALKKSPNSISMPLLLGNVAFETGHYRDASQALNSVLNNEQGRQPGVYNLLAECLIAQGRPAEAIDYSSHAIRLSPKANFMAVKAKAQRNASNLEDALSTINQALSLNPDNLESLTEKALILIAMNQYAEAIKVLDRALMNDSENLYALYLSAYAHENLNDNKDKDVYIKMLNTTSVPSTPAMKALKAIAQIKNGKGLDADASLREMVKVPTADNCYWAAVAYAVAGDKQHSQALAKQARELGFENIYMLDSATGPLTLRP